MYYGKILTVSVLLIAGGASLWAMNDLSAEERLSRAVIRQNEAITEANSARVESYTQIYDLCRKSASGSSHEILQQYRDCKGIAEPKLEELVSTGSII